jgi:hypothetical protein
MHLRELGFDRPSRPTKKVLDRSDRRTGSFHLGAGYGTVRSNSTPRLFGSSAP